MKILAFESSCDETAAAVVENGRTAHSNVVASQVEQHKIYGGVVPEIAGRIHIEAISAVAQQALSQANCSLNDIDAIAVTHAPGLIGALLVGLNFAKSLAYGSKKPLIPVHHLRAHVAANYLTHVDLQPPFLSLVVSGGHTSIIEVLDYTHFRTVGKTRDDAAGEALDKTARMLGLSYPGGVHLDILGQGGSHTAYQFPRPRVDGYDFSFSGLKTAALNQINQSNINIKDFSASFQHAVATYLCDNTVRAAQSLGYQKIALAGGVCANSVLRAEITQRCDAQGLSLFLPEPRWCGDNAAMVGAQAYYEYQAGIVAPFDLNAFPTLAIDQ